MRSNVYKEKIVSLLEKSHLLSITDMQKKLPDADFSTLFRNVEQLVNEKSVRKVVISKDSILYEMVDKKHHDHFVCNDCGVIESVNMPKKILLNGKAIATDILIRGICAGCVK